MSFCGHEAVVEKTHIFKLIDGLRSRSDVEVQEHRDASLVLIHSQDFLCEVTIPCRCYEWFVRVSRNSDGQEIWRDWADHYGASESALDEEMVRDITAFVDRALRSGVTEKLSLYEIDDQLTP
jgi:hypothetical protein